MSKKDLQIRIQSLDIAIQVMRVGRDNISNLNDEEALAYVAAIEQLKIMKEELEKEYHDTEE